MWKFPVMNTICVYLSVVFGGGTVVKNPPPSVEDAADTGSIPGLGRSPGVGNDNPLQYSCQENSMGREAWWATVHVVAKSQTCQSTHNTIVKKQLILFHGSGGLLGVSNLVLERVLVSFKNIISLKRGT